MSIHFQIITPDGIAYENDVESIILPGALGEMGVLDKHAALITSVERGMLRYLPTVTRKEESVYIGVGFFQVLDNKVILVTKFALEATKEAVCSIEDAIDQAEQNAEKYEKLSGEERAQFEADLAKQLSGLGLRRKQQHYPLR